MHTAASPWPLPTRPGTHPAVEHDRLVLVDRAGLRRDPLKLDVARSRQPSGVPFVRLADVDQLDLTGLVVLAHPLRRHVDVIRMESVVTCHAQEVSHPVL